MSLHSSLPAASLQSQWSQDPHFSWQEQPSAFPLAHPSSSASCLKDVSDYLKSQAWPLRNEVGPLILTATTHWVVIQKVQLHQQAMAVLHQLASECAQHLEKWTGGAIRQRGFSRAHTELTLNGEVSGVLDVLKINEEIWVVGVLFLETITSQYSLEPDAS